MWIGELALILFVAGCGAGNDTADNNKRANGISNNGS